MLQMTKIDVEGFEASVSGSENRGNEIEGDSIASTSSGRYAQGRVHLTADGKRERGVSGPHFAGGDYHVKGSPADPNRLYVSQSSGCSGKLFNAPTMGAKHGFSRERLSGERLARSAEGSSTSFVYDVFETGKPLTRISFTTVRSIPGSSSGCGIWSRRSPILTRFMRGGRRGHLPLDRRGENWKELPGLRGHGTGQVAAGCGGMCLHTIILDPALLLRRRSGSGSRFRRRRVSHRRWRKTWKSINRG